MHEKRYRHVPIIEKNIVIEIINENSIFNHFSDEEIIEV